MKKTPTNKPNLFFTEYAPKLKNNKIKIMTTDLEDRLINPSTGFKYTNPGFLSKTDKVKLYRHILGETWYEAFKKLPRERVMKI